MNRCDRLSALIVDDQTEVLEVYHDILGSTLNHQVECVHSAGEAVRRVGDQLFDIVLVDAKITYKGAPLGGLILADEVAGILGVETVLLMSQFDVQQQVAGVNSQLAFLPKPRNGESPLNWAKVDLMRKVKSLVDRQYAFVAMPYGDEATERWYTDRLVPWMAEAGHVVERMDQIPTKRPINHDLFLRIRNAHLVVLVASPENANAYLETGFAFGLDKFVLILAPDLERLPFNIRSHHAISTTGSDCDVRERILSCMHGLRGLDPLRHPRS